MRLKCHLCSQQQDVLFDCFPSLPMTMTITLPMTMTMRQGTCIQYSDTHTSVASLETGREDHKGFRKVPNMLKKVLKRRLLEKG